MTVLAMKKGDAIRVEGPMFVSSALAKQAVDLHELTPTLLDIAPPADDELPANTQIINGKLHRRRGRLDITPSDRIADNAPVDIPRARRAIEQRVLGAIGTAARQAMRQQSKKMAFDFKVIEATRASGRAADEKKSFVNAVRTNIVSGLEISDKLPGTLLFLNELATEFYRWARDKAQAREFGFSVHEDGSLFVHQGTMRADLPPLDRG